MPKNGQFAKKIISQLLPIPHSISSGPKNRSEIVSWSFFVNFIVFLMGEILANFEKLDFLIW
jgi:hypothetical protein